jgi:myotubularin-related protein 5/13
VECGIAAVEDKRGSLASHHKSVDTGSDDEGVYPGAMKAILCVIVSVHLWNH